MTSVNNYIEKFVFKKNYFLIHKIKILDNCKRKMTTQVIAFIRLAMKNLNNDS